MGSQTSKEHQPTVEEPTKAAVEDDDEPDEWEKRIYSTGCAEENAKMTDCYFEKKDWRACKEEMERFKECWKAHGNDKRVYTKDA